MIIAFVILLNTLALALDHHHISDKFEQVLTTINHCCGAVFAVEVLVRLYALGPRRVCPCGAGPVDPCLTHAGHSALIMCCM